MRSVLLAFALVAAAVSCAADPINTQGTGGAANGGTTGKGGTTSNGGTTSKGGTTGTGGTTSTGGTTNKGGTTGTGGTTSKGGTTGNGGTTSKGGTTGNGGSSQSTGPVDCTDTSTFSASIKDQYGATAITTADNNKSYYMQANWWGIPYNNQSEAISGLGFTITNPNNTVASSKPSDPLGFPSIFIGAYGSKKTTPNNLPKLVSSLTSVPTIFSTNADTMGISNYNATYDVWFTASSAPVTGSSPGPGGAYLMVWLFMPQGKQPRGVIKANASIVKGVKGGWDVWYDPSTNNMPCVSYVSITELASLEFDLNNFIQDAKQSGYGITDSQYLSIVFAGFEIWQGGDGLQLKKFCANVK